MTPIEYIESARTMLGVPFKHQGRHERAGLDCAGLAVVAATRLGVPVHDFRAYQRIPEVSDFSATLDMNADKVPRGEERPGDIGVFQFAHNPQHMTILTMVAPRYRIIHAYGPMGKVVEHDLDATWMARLVSFHRVKGMQWLS